MKTKTNGVAFFAAALLLILGFAIVPSAMAQEEDLPGVDVIAPDVYVPEAAQPQSDPQTTPHDLEQTPQAPSENSARMAEEKALSEPTRSLDEYEKARKEKRAREDIPNYATSLLVAPKAFKSVDFRYPVPAAGAPGSGDKKPNLIGVELTFEKALVNHFGHLFIGAAFNIYGSSAKGAFEGMFPAGSSIAPMAQYEANFFYRQPLVPFARFAFEVLRYSYKFVGVKNRDIRTIPRFDLGAMLYLNFFEPSAASEMKANFGIKRTYLMASYSIARDSSPDHFDFTDRSWKFGFRFEY